MKRKFIRLKPGQTWVSPDGKQRTVMEVFPATVQHDERARVTNPDGITSIIAVRSMRAWISNERAELVEPS